MTDHLEATVNRGNEAHLQIGTSLNICFFNLFMIKTLSSVKGLIDMNENPNQTPRTEKIKLNVSMNRTDIVKLTPTPAQASPIVFVYVIVYSQSFIGQIL